MYNSELIHNKTVLGLDFVPELVEKAMKNNEMLVLDIDFTKKCNLNCYYCDRTPDRTSQEKLELSFEERKKIIKEAKNLGAWAVGIVGAGEPMLDDNFWELLGYINQLDMIPLVYASGSEIKDLATARRLRESNASIMLKHNTETNGEIDKIVGKKGHGEHSKKVFDWLLEAGFNNESPTRLGINVVLTKKNEEERKEFFELYHWCRENNVYLHGQSLIPMGKGNSDELLLHKNEALSILKTACEIDKKYFSIDYEVVPPITSGFRCRKVNVGLFINVFGEIWDCNGSGRKLGDARKNTLTEIWNTPFAKSLRKEKQEGKCHLREYCWAKEK